MLVFFDASVIIAALLSPSGGSSLLLQYVKKGIVIGITSQTVIDEILDEDKPKRLKRSFVEINEFVARSRLMVSERVVDKEIKLYEGKIDVEDAHLIVGANLTKCDYLVSLDKKHVVRRDVQKIFLPLQIITPKELLQVIVSKELRQ